MKKVYVETDKGNMVKFKADYGIFIGSKDKEVAMTPIGQSSIEEMNDLIYSGLLHVYNSAMYNFSDEDNEDEMREEIYKRAVQMFSLIMDKFHPEAKDKKYGILTDKDIYELENKKLDSLSKQK